MSDAKDVHPFQTLVYFLLGGLEVESDGIFQSAGHNLQGRDVLFVAAMHLRRHVADMFLDIPDAFPATTSVSEK